MDSGLVVDDAHCFVVRHTRLRLQKIVSDVLLSVSVVQIVGCTFVGAVQVGKSGLAMTSVIVRYSRNLFYQWLAWMVMHDA